MTEIKPKIVDGEPVCDEDCPAWCRHDDPSWGRKVQTPWCNRLKTRAHLKDPCIHGLRQQRDRLQAENDVLKMLLAEAKNGAAESARAHAELEAEAHRLREKLPHVGARIAYRELEGRLRGLAVYTKEVLSQNDVWGYDSDIDAFLPESEAGDEDDGSL